MSQGLRRPTLQGRVRLYNMAHFAVVGGENFNSVKT